MAWDASKHKTLGLKTIEVTESTSIVVEKYSYDGGPERIKLGKVVKKANGTVNHAPLSGIDLEYIPAVTEAMRELSL